MTIPKRWKANVSGTQANSAFL